MWGYAGKLATITLAGSVIIEDYKPFTDEAQTALFKDPVRTAL